MTEYVFRNLCYIVVQCHCFQNNLLLRYQSRSLLVANTSIKVFWHSGLELTLVKSIHKFIVISWNVSWFSSKWNWNFSVNFCGWEVTCLLPSNSFNYWLQLTVIAESTKKSEKVLSLKEIEIKTKQNKTNISFHLLS